jgi:Cu2+-exporting ATPase
MIAETLQLDETLTETAEAVLCAHCSLEVPAGLVDAEAEHQFCCAGCRAVFETIHACGLDSYYKLREAAVEAKFAPAKPGEDSFAAFDAPAFEGLYVTQASTGASSADLLLEGVT